MQTEGSEGIATFHALLLEVDVVVPFVSDDFTTSEAAHRDNHACKVGWKIVNKTTKSY